MNEINYEIKLTLNLMQTDIDDSAHGELQHHLNGLLEMKRVRLVAKTGLQAEYQGGSECLVDALEKIADLKLPSTGGLTEFGKSQDRLFKFCEAQKIAASAIAQYRNEPDKPLTVEELKAGEWWCDDVSEGCQMVFAEKGLKTKSPQWSSEEGYKYCYLSGSIIRRSDVQVSSSTLKQIHRIGDEFYWSENEN